MKGVSIELHFISNEFVIRIRNKQHCVKSFDNVQKKSNLFAKLFFDFVIFFSYFVIGVFISERASSKAFI